MLLSWLTRGLRIKYFQLIPCELFYSLLGLLLASLVATSLVFAYGFTLLGILTQSASGQQRERKPLCN